MKIYVIRHGQTDCNTKQIYNGRYDEDINARGVNQALNIKSKIKDLKIELVVCSPMLRTKHTLELLDINKPVIFDERILDKDFGDLTLKNVGIYDGNMFGVESDEAIYSRVSELLNELKTKYGNVNILIVTHGAVTRAISKYFNKENVQQNNCEIKEYDM